MSMQDDTTILEVRDLCENPTCKFYDSRHLGECVQNVADGTQLRERKEDLPLPTRGDRAVTPILRRAFNRDLTKRNALGIERYRQPLKTWIGRPPLQDGWEELLDLTQYFKQAMLEWQDVWQILKLLRVVLEEWKSTTFGSDISPTMAMNLHKILFKFNRLDLFTEIEKRDVIQTRMDAEDLSEDRPDDSETN